MLFSICLILILCAPILDNALDWIDGDDQMCELYESMGEEDEREDDEENSFELFSSFQNRLDLAAQDNYELFDAYMDVFCNVHLELQTPPPETLL